MKNILLGVTGSIAAYKSPEIVRNLRSEGFSVRVVLSESAKEFVTETTLQAVSSYPVRSSLSSKIPFWLISSKGSKSIEFASKA